MAEEPAKRAEAFKSDRETDIGNRTIRFRKTHHGPVFGVRDGHPLAVRVAGIEGGIFEQRWAMAKARSLTEFKGALSRVSFTGSVFAWLLTFFGSQSYFPQKYVLST